MSQIGIDKGDYIFSASTREITFIGVSVTSIEQIKPIINYSAKIDIFNPLSPGKGGILKDNVLTLEYDTSGQNDFDPLFICIHFQTEEGATKLNQYTQLDLLNLIYEELQTQTKLLKKIYQ